MSKPKTIKELATCASKLLQTLNGEGLNNAEIITVLALADKGNDVLAIMHMTELKR